MPYVTTVLRTSIPGRSKSTAFHPLRRASLLPIVGGVTSRNETPCLHGAGHILVGYFEWVDTSIFWQAHIDFLAWPRAGVD
eukprot:COSAG02_NODE_49322_length_327_cov_1.135965_1_plen_80_part_10